jgi:hypothetical protein
MQTFVALNSVYVHVYMCAYVVYMCVHLYINVFVCVCINVRVCIYCVYMYSYLRIHISVCIQDICVNISSFIIMCAFACVCVYVCVRLQKKPKL